MKNTYLISLLAMLLVVGGKGLAQTSSTAEKKAAPFYAIAELGTGLSVYPHCVPMELSHSLGLGLRIGKYVGLGINHHMTIGLSPWGYSDRKFRGMSVHSFVLWRKFRLMVELGQSLNYEDGCNDERTGYHFNADEESLRPYFRISPSFQPIKPLYFFVSWLQTASTAGTYTYFDYYTYGQGPASLSLSSVQFGVGLYLGR
ncbi:MAG: hypothetical protein AAF927_32600 [Bacteroidota bacterium]